MRIYLFKIFRLISVLCICNPVYSLSLEEIWDNLDKTVNSWKTASEKSTQSLSFLNILSTQNKPAGFHRESIAYKLHKLCHEYYIKEGKETPSFYRPQIETLVWDFYLPQIHGLQYGEPKFECVSSPLSQKTKIYVTFRLDLTKGFYPNVWKKKQGENLLEVREAFYNREGKVEKTTTFHSQLKNCPINGKEDTNLSGNPDRWYFYNDCKLTRIEEDYNEDGKKERICKSNGTENNLKCIGIGEKNISLANKYKISQPKLSIQYFKEAISEWESAFGIGSRHVCSPLLEIMKLNFEMNKFNEVSEIYFQIESNPFCKKEKLEAQVFDAFTNLYKFKEYKLATEKYEKANHTYREENGWHSVEMNLALALAYLKSGEPQKCIRSMDRIKLRKLTEDTNYLVFYYLGSCELDAGERESSFQNLKKAQAFAKSPEEKAQVYLKLGVLLWDDPNTRKDALEYWNEAESLNPIHKKFIQEYKKYKSFLAE